MRIVEKIAIFALFLMISCGVYASPEICRSELRELIVPPLEHVAMNKRNIQVDLEDTSDGVYSVRLYVQADSPDNFDKRVSIGWVNLDTNSMKVLDMTRDPDHPDVLKVNAEKYRKFVSDCIRKPSKAAMSCDELNKHASHAVASIPLSESGMTVIGSGRLQFYSAPSLECKMKGVFILTGESVNAYIKYNGFTSVAYVSSKNNDPVKGWVRSTRLKRNDLEISPREPANNQ
ncbi:hypothetical protein [Burkholderia guangdongensis]|uniref:hypothetical protein n=1 Tax=Burkholderia guangdongensis TaxID=1792500 RepID=UPI001FECC504|nr:hypothetical protein [Burkholderia guangdongensis]